MKLTDKAKRDFEKYYLKEYHGLVKNKTTLKLQLLVWYSLPLSKQYGVYVDFFDNVDIDIYIEIGKYGGLEPLIWYKKYYHLETVSTRKQARIEAILKANEIYNGR